MNEREKGKYKVRIPEWKTNSTFNMQSDKLAYVFFSSVFH